MKEIFDKLNSIAKGVRLIKPRSNTLDSVKKIFNCRISKDLEEWYKVYNGGNVFSVHFYSTNYKIDGIKNKLNLRSINSVEFRKQLDMPNDIVCFAETNYGGYYCFATDELDDCV